MKKILLHAVFAVITADRAAFARQDAEFYFNRGKAYGRKGEYENTIADYTEAIRIIPNDAEAYTEKGKRVIIAFVYFVALGASVFAMGSTQSGSGQYRQFNYQDGNVNRNARAEYIGYYLKEFSVKANGTVLVVQGNFCPWDGEFTGWEDLGEERIPYGNMLDPRDVLEGTAEGVALINVAKTDGSTIILEVTPDEDGDYWWWTTNGTIQFFQNVWVVR